MYRRNPEMPVIDGWTHSQSGAGRCATAREPAHSGARRRAKRADDEPATYIAGCLPISLRNSSLVRKVLQPVDQQFEAGRGVAVGGEAD